MKIILNSIYRINLKNTGNNIKTLMKMNDVTVRELADYFGLNYTQAIYKWLNGKCLPQADKLIAMSRLFNVNVEKILAVEEIILTGRIE